MRHVEQETGLLARVKSVEAIGKALVRGKTAAQRFLYEARRSNRDGKEEFRSGAILDWV